jgi:hypothetical protein
MREKRSFARYCAALMIFIAICGSEAKGGRGGGGFSRGGEIVQIT